MPESASGTEDDPSVRSVRLHGPADFAWRRRGPTRMVMSAFGARGDALHRMPGGQGNAWTDGRLVLKPVGLVSEHNWVSAVFANWKAPEVRVPEPVTANGEGGWSVDGWGAHVFVPGHEVQLPLDVGRVREASGLFHHCIKQLPRPDFIDERDDPWALGDRVAWEGAEPHGDARALELIELLLSHLTPVTGAEQVIHGDILPNVLLSPGLAPAVIDWPPYYRPVEMADAIAATDAVTFHGAPLSLLDEWSTGEQWRQFLVRALLYRLGTTGFFASRDQLMGPLVTHVAHVRPVVDFVLSMT